jgi:16S rRNA (guanine966-N2)-methyltransferase
VRLAVFNMLNARGLPDENTTVLDAFCGTGALGLEALSRGAGFCAFIDSSRDSLSCARDNAAALKLQEQTLFLHGDACAPPERRDGTAPASLVFIDPPYRKDMAAPALAALAKRGWIAPEALCVIECAADENPALPPSFTEADERIHGDTKIIFCRYNPA